MIKIIKIAWRNIWRNKLRSSVVMISIILGLWSGLFIMAMTFGLNEQRINGAINTVLSHVQIHNPRFLEDQKINDTIINKSKLIDAINNSDKISHYAERIISTGMVANAKGTYGIQLTGIKPEDEKKVTEIFRKIKQGDYFTRLKRNPAVIGEKLAKKMKLKLNSKIIVTLQNSNGDLVNAAFRVEGIYKTQNTAFDEVTIFVKKSDLTKIVGFNNGQVHEIAIVGKSIDDASLIAQELKNTDKTNKIETWSEISPELGYAQEMMGTFLFIFMGIVLLALSFGIINAMLMAVLERKKELGMLMAIGMKKKSIFSMITFETVFLTLIATPIGLLLSYISIEYYAKHGIDLSNFAKGLESLGIGAIMHTYLPLKMYLNVSLLTIAVAFVSSLFPARRALKLNPAEAIKSL